MTIKITWYSHACFLIETDQSKLLIDPFISGNPLSTVKADAIETDYILVSHGHGDHLGDTVDIAKRLMDYGFHPPTVYFPLIVPEALMIEPTETESKETLDAFAEAMLKIAEEAQENPDFLHRAPHTAPVTRLDEVRAARHPKLRWKPS